MNTWHWTIGHSCIEGQRAHRSPRIASAGGRRCRARPSLITCAVLLTSLVAITAGCSETVIGPKDDSATNTEPVVVTGCDDDGSHHMAPNGYYVQGNTICSFKGEPHLFHGVGRPSLEWGSGQYLSAGDFKLMADWKANVVRIPLNQDFWLAESPLARASYPTTVDQVVRWAEEAGLDVILDLHWSDQGKLGSCTNDSGKGCQQLMADRNSVTFWQQVAEKYKDDGRVLFELYNEPKGVPWSTWAYGGSAGSWDVVGMQELYDTVRAQGAENLIIIGGLFWGYDLSGIENYPIEGYNILYSTHPYNNAAERAPSNWPRYWGFAAADRPVIVGEFGDLKEGCTAQFSEQLIQYADERHASWVAWAWWVSGCTFPSVIDDWKGTPSVQGVAVRDAMQGYDDPAPAGIRAPAE